MAEKAIEQFNHRTLGVSHDFALNRFTLLYLCHSLA
jgi:hypothetical protein